jgi:type IV pilus assembly protein PilW
MHCRRWVTFSNRGVSLLELLMAMLAAAILLIGLVQIVAAARSSFLLQESMAELQESGRFAFDSLAAVLRQAAYTPEPWQSAGDRVGLTSETRDAVSSKGDRLAMRTWSERNCYGSANTATGASGRPRFYLMESIFTLSSSGNLAFTCRYGPTAGQLVTQVLNQGLLENLEAFQALYAEDLNNDGQADRWVKGGQWLDQSRISGLQIAVLLRSDQLVTDGASRSYTVLDEVINAPADGKLRRVFTYSQALRGRRG